VDANHRVLFPRFAGLRVADTAPKVDDLFAAVIHAARATHLLTTLKIPRERFANPFEAGTDVSLDNERF
jgi:hypothetical protein